MYETVVGMKVYSGHVDVGRMNTSTYTGQDSTDNNESNSRPCYVRSHDHTVHAARSSENVDVSLQEYTVSLPSNKSTGPA
jgi:hypothetical protein